jgi:hypothetical protein
MKYILTLLLFVVTINKVVIGQEKDEKIFNQLAEEYVRTGLAIGVYDDDFVDAYYGPDSLKPDFKNANQFPKDSFIRVIQSLQLSFKQYLKADSKEAFKTRAKWISSQLTAFERRVRIFAGEYADFDTEAKELFGVKPPVYQEDYFKEQVKKLEQLLPGKGSIHQRFQDFANRFIIPKNKLDTVFKTAISVSRSRTLQHFKLPAEESFKLEYVTGKSWSGYNWYKGNYSSLIQLNTDTDIFIERVIDVGSHESYPGHHVYNMLLEQQLFKGKGWVEISLYPLFSPQSLIAEGSANYGIEMAFPGEEKVKFAKEVLLPIAALDTTGISLYFDLLALKGKLNFVRNEVARGLLNKTMNEAEALRWLMEYGLNNEATARKSIAFIQKYRSYVINYNYGMELVKTYIEQKGASQNQWDRFYKLLSTAFIPTDLQ